MTETQKPTLLSAVLDATLGDARASASSLLSRATGEDAATVERTLRRLAEIQSSLLIQPPADGVADPRQEEVASLLNTLSAVATRYGLDAIREAREFAERLLYRLREAALTALFALIPSA